MVKNGPIYDNLMVCHKCDNPSCINVDHLFLGTNQENQQDSIRKGRRKKIKVSHCKYGHEYNDKSTGYYKSGKRYCKPCNREYSTIRRRDRGTPFRGEYGPRKGNV